MQFSVFLHIGLRKGLFVTSGEIRKRFTILWISARTFAVEYPAKILNSKETAELLAPTSVIETESWGLDHGAWSVIRHLYPEAQIPVIQMSIDYTQPAQYHFDLAKKNYKN